MPPVNGGPELGTQIWLQNPEPKPGPSWAEVKGRGGSLGGAEGDTCLADHGQRINNCKE